MAATPGDATHELPLGPASHANAIEERGFRHDINALRALAASVVVLFHFNVAGFGGGFVGVDIFFVISGLLMTQIIDRGIERGHFSILRFYDARARRIIPALAMLCTLLVAAGCFLVDPLTLGELARNAVASVLFVSNMIYAREAGYFADASENNWLLHTWTLSAEWQFYMIYPVILAAISRWQWLWDRRLALLGTGCVLICAATIFIAGRSAHFREVAFFILPTRSWEMLAGGVLALAPAIARRHAGPVLAAGGIALAFAIFGFDDAVPWPSAWAAVPVLGTIAVLAAGNHAEFARPRWARAGVVQWLGLRSYSLYLWHWPVYVALNYAEVTMSPGIIAFGVALSLVLAELSYRYVELALRDALFGTARFTPLNRWAALATAAAICVTAMAFVSGTDGLERWRIAGLPATTQAQLIDYRLAEDDWSGLEPCSRVERFVTSKICILNPSATKRIAIIGDSHAEQLIQRYKLLAERNSLGIDVYINTSCPPLSGVIWTHIGDKCTRFADRIFDHVAPKHYSKVMIQAAWALYFGSQSGKWEQAAICSPGWLGCRPEYDDAVVAQRVDRAFGRLAHEVRRLATAGVEVGLVLPEPMNFDMTPRDYYKLAFFDDATPEGIYFEKEHFLSRTSMVRAKIVAVANGTGAALIDPIDAMCQSGKCPIRVDGQYLLKDTHHVRSSLARFDQFDYVDAFIIG